MGAPVDSPGEHRHRRRPHRARPRAARRVPPDEPGPHQLAARPARCRPGRLRGPGRGAGHPLDQDHEQGVGHRHRHLDDRPHHPRGRRHPRQGARPGGQGPGARPHRHDHPAARPRSASTATWSPPPRRPWAAAGSRSRPSPRPSRAAARACRSSSPTSRMPCKAGADEIDMVIDRGAFLAGDYLTVFSPDRRGEGDLRQRPAQGDHGDRRAGHLRQRASRLVAVDARRRRLHQDLHRQDLPRRDPAGDA